MNKPLLPTLEDVAKRAQVSTATVSRSLNTPDRVAKATRDKVNAAIAALDYSPNFGARALASKRTNTYGAIIPTMANAIFASGLQAFQEALAERGATLLVASSFYDHEIEEQQIRSMVARGADGLLLIGNSRSEAIYQFLEQQNIPIVLTWIFNAKSKYNMVGFDNRAASFELTQRAIGLGHRRFAFLSAVRHNNDRAAERVKGAQQALAAAGIDPNSMPILETPYSIEEAGDTFEQLVNLDSKPTIVMCGNDVQAVGALKKAREMGIDVPGDISITGFDDLEIASVVDPGITTVHVPHRQMGRRSAELLVSGDAKTKPCQTRLATYLVERGSLAAPGQAG